MVLGALGFVAQLNDSSGLSLVCGLGEFAIGIWMFIEPGCLRGTRGPDRFGPDPQNRPGPGRDRAGSARLSVSGPAS